MHSTRNLKVISILAFLSLILNIALALALLPNSNQSPYSKNVADYPYLSKRIFADSQNDILIYFVPLRNAMREYVETQSDEIGVYFEYLPSGTSIGVNDKMEIRFASLIKIPVVMAVYKQIEQNMLSKDQILVVSEENIHEGFGSLWQKGAGTEISVEEAIEASLVESDNTALRTLVSVLPLGAIEDVFNNLDITIDSGQGYPIISPKNYSSILRSLYLSSYLTNQNSNEILNLLTQSSFNDKIQAGVDPWVKVAHKIGVFEPDNIQSDCGIVYVPNRPYIICVMVRGTEETAIKHMVHLSKMVFGYVASVNN